MHVEIVATKGKKNCIGPLAGMKWEPFQCTELCKLL